MARLQAKKSTERGETLTILQATSCPEKGAAHLAAPPAAAIDLPDALPAGDRGAIGRAQVAGKRNCLAQRLGESIKVFYQSKRVLGRIKACGGKAVIPSHRHRLRPREHNHWQHCFRHLIDNFFAKIKQHRAIAKRYDKTPCNFLGAIHLSTSVIWPPASFGRQRHLA